MRLQTFAQQTVALTNTKAVLLIDHHETQPLKANGVFQQRVGSHQNLAAP